MKTYGIAAIVCVALLGAALILISFWVEMGETSWRPVPEDISTHPAASSSTRSTTGKGSVEENSPQLPEQLGGSKLALRKQQEQDSSLFDAERGDRFKIINRAIGSNVMADLVAGINALSDCRHFFNLDPSTLSNELPDLKSSDPGVYSKQKGAVEILKDRCGRLSMQADQLKYESDFLLRLAAGSDDLKVLMAVAEKLQAGKSIAPSEAHQFCAALRKSGEGAGVNLIAFPAVRMIVANTADRLFKDYSGASDRRVSMALDRIRCVGEGSCQSWSTEKLIACAVEQRCSLADFKGGVLERAPEKSIEESIGAANVVLTKLRSEGCIGLF